MVVCTMVIGNWVRVECFVTGQSKYVISIQVQTGKQLIPIINERRPL